MTPDLVEWEQKGKPFIGTPQQLVDEMTYSSYRHQRKTCPEATVKSWATIFGPKTPLMEQRYQQELSHG